MAGAVGTFTGGVNPASLATGTGAANWFTSNGNTTQASSSGLLASPYNATTNSYSGLDYRPATGSTALSGANFTDTSISQYVIVPVLGATPVVTAVSIFVSSCW